MKISSVTLTVVSGNMENRRMLCNGLSLYKTEINQKVSYHENKI